MNEKERLEYKKTISDQLNQIKEQRSQKPRDLSQEVQTRYYRAPEVILTNKSYDFAVDVWGIGLVLGEMLRKKDHRDQFKRSEIFQGNSCYPISPFNDEDEHVVDKDDQLACILRKYPKLSKDEDLSFVS